jgi:hypothetical protein
MNMKQMLIGLFALLGVQGVAFANTSAYSPPDGHYEIRYPSGWRAVTDARELELMQRQIGGMMPELKMAKTPDVFFISGMTIAAVTRFRLPPEMSGIDINAYIEATMKQHVGEDIRRQQIGEHVFVVHAGSTPAHSHFYYASTIQKGEVIALRFAGHQNMTAEERGIYEGVVASLKLKESGKEPAIEAEKEGTDAPPRGKKPAGFWTGLWHGGLVLPRWILSWFTGSKVFSIHNTGSGYLVGFIIGVLAFLTSGGTAKR